VAAALTECGEKKVVGAILFLRLCRNRQPRPETSDRTEIRHSPDGANIYGFYYTPQISAPRSAPPRRQGSAALSSQSGQLAWRSSAFRARRRWGAAIVGLGNKSYRRGRSVDVLRTGRNTHIIAQHCEDFKTAVPSDRQGVSKKKPIVVLKAGRIGGAKRRVAHRRALPVTTRSTRTLQPAGRDPRAHCATC
jgi:acyl-CoA synthetase (NDP forming)